jgi:alpha-methylacyl-CoA racemase
MGADVVRIDREGGNNPLGLKVDVLNRGRRSVALDLKSSQGVATCLDLVAKADALIEGYRPGVMERLGLGPRECQARNPHLVYGRMTGWGQEGPLADAAGHDINYIALTGALSAMGTRESVVPPLNLVGDFGGGALYLAFGVVCAMLEGKSSGKGQVVDAAMVDGAAHLMTMMYGLKHNGLWVDHRSSNLLDGGAHFYGAFECADGEWVAIGSIEPQFYKLLLQGVGIDPGSSDASQESANWPKMRERLQAVFLRQPRAHWCALMEGTDICFAPVLSMSEAPEHPHNVARETFVREFDVLQPAPAPRFARTPGAIAGPPPAPGEHTAQVLKEWGVE